MSDPNQPRVDVLERRMREIHRLLAGLTVPCDCDFTEQGQMTGCPTVRVNRAAEIARKSIATHPDPSEVP